MLTTLYHFADLLKDEEGLQTYFSSAKNPFEGHADKGKVLVGDIKDGRFISFSLENFRSGLIEKYLYRRPAGARGTNTVPTLIINTNSPEKTANKFEQSIKKYNLDFLDEDEIGITYSRAVTFFPL
jgi:hypothetical protein